MKALVLTGPGEFSVEDVPRPSPGPEQMLLLQAINHGTEHRAQVATTLTPIGVTPPGMDGWDFFFGAGHMIPV
jgi:uncharacterized damage-inducible protein DinB